MTFDEEIQTLSTLADALKKTKDLGEKQELLLAHPRVVHGLSKKESELFLPHEHDLYSKIALYSLIAIGQHHHVFRSPKKSALKEKGRSLLSALVSIDLFYESIGGIVGYHLAILKMLRISSVPMAKVNFSRAPAFDLTQPSDEIEAKVWAGIQAIEEMGEIYPMGGLGSRLNLMSKNHEPLPAASLPFSGRTLLEGLVRDVQAKEFLYYRLFQKQVTIPIAMMTSFEKQNALRVEGICEKKKWFGRPKESFLLFPQISVPVVTQEGIWSMKAPLEPNLQPGGHGALWKAAEENGVFLWFQKQEKNHLLIRQINNPIAGLDFGLLSLIGIGKEEKKAFGFASCERLPHAAEGALVLVEEDGKQRLSNIEYTDFKHYGFIETATKNGFSEYPANTNILYANLQNILPVIKKNPLPGLMLNMKNKEPYFCSEGIKREAFAGRLESMMQNISDALYVDKKETLPTFLTYNARRKTISTTKRSFEVGKSLLETPEGAFYDLLSNAYELLTKNCGGDLPPFSTTEEYLKSGPSLLFLYHPALGPLYELIVQKILKPQIAAYSEMQLEIADLLLDSLNLNGSLLIEAKQPLGHDSQGITRYSHKTGKCILKNVRIANKGIHRRATKCYWKNQIKRHESLIIRLEGHSEFYAENVVFEGNHLIEVPHGEKWVASQDNKGVIHYTIEKPNWRWNYQKVGRRILFNITV